MHAALGRVPQATEVTVAACYRAMDVGRARFPVEPSVFKTGGVRPARPVGSTPMLFRHEASPTATQRPAALAATNNP